MKYQLFYVYQTKKETGGEWWPIAFGIICCSIIFFQGVTFLSLATICGETTPQAIYVTILPFITIGFWYACTRYYGEKAKYLQGKPGNSVPVQMVDPVYNEPLNKVWVHERHEELYEKMQEGTIVEEGFATRK